MLVTNNLKGLRGMCRRWRFTSQVGCVENLWYNAWVSVVCLVVEGGSWGSDVENIASINGVA